MFSYNTAVMHGPSRHADIKFNQWTGTGSIKFNDETQSAFNVTWDESPNSRGTFALVAPSSPTPTEPVGYFRNKVFLRNYSLLDFKGKQYVVKRSSFLRFSVLELNQEVIPNSIELRDLHLDSNSTEIGIINMQLWTWGCVLKFELILDQQYEMTHHQLPALLLYSRMQIVSRNTMIFGCIFVFLQVLWVHHLIRVILAAK